MAGFTLKSYQAGQDASAILSLIVILKLLQDVSAQLVINFLLNNPFPQYCFHILKIVFFLSNPQYQLAGCTRAQMHRGVANLVHDIRVPGAAGVFRGAVWDPLRQKLEPATRQPAKGTLSSAAGATTAAYQSLTGGLLDQVNFIWADSLIFL